MEPGIPIPPTILNIFWLLDIFKYPFAYLVVNLLGWGPKGVFHCNRISRNLYGYCWNNNFLSGESGS
jgi:hypothetical protein